MLLIDLASEESNMLVWLVTPTYGLIPFVWLTSSYALEDVEYTEIGMSLYSADLL